MRQGVSRQQYFNNRMVTKIYKLKNASIFERQSIAIILNIMVYNDNKFRNDICEKYPQILTLDNDFCPWIMIYKLTK